MSDTIIIAAGTSDIDDTSKTAENVTSIVKNAKAKGYTNIVIVPPNPDKEYGFPELHDLVKNAATSAGATVYSVDGLYHGKEQPELLKKESAAEIKNSYPGAIIAGDSNAARINSFNLSTTIKKDASTSEILNIIDSSKLPDAVEEDPISTTAFVIDSVDRAILDLIAKGESGRHGYYAHYSDSKHATLTSETLRGVQKFQNELLSEQKKRTGKSESCAIGRYQFVKSPLEETIKYLGLDKDLTVFTPKIQDVICLGRLYNRRNYKKWKLGKFTDIDFMINLCKEFASIPLPVPINGKAKGESYYSGVLNNSAHGNPDEFLQSIKDAKKGGTGKSTRVDVTTNSMNTASPNIGSNQKRITEHAVSNGQITTGGKFVNSHPSTPSELPFVENAYSYERIDPQDDRYDFRTGKKIRDVCHLGETSTRNFPDYAPPGTSQTGVAIESDNPKIQNSLNKTILAGPSGIPIEITDKTKIENAKQIKDQLGKVGINDLNSVCNIVGMCENVSGLTTEYVKSYENVPNNEIRNRFGSSVANFSDAQLNDLKSSPEKFYDEILKNDGGSAFAPAGFLGITGKQNFEKISKIIDLDIVNSPHLLDNPITSAQTAAVFFGENQNVVDLTSTRNVFVQTTGVDPFTESNLNKRYEYMNQFKDVSNKAETWQTVFSPIVEKESTQVAEVQTDSLLGVSDKPLPQSFTKGKSSQENEVSSSEKLIESFDSPEMLQIVNNTYSERDGKIYDQDGVEIGEAPVEEKIKVKYDGDVFYDDPEKEFANDGTGRIVVV